MANQMVNFLSSMTFPKSCQSFMIGSMTWVINANGIGKVVETVRDNPTPNVLASVTPAPTPKAPTSASHRAR